MIARSALGGTSKGEDIILGLKKMNVKAMSDCGGLTEDCQCRSNRLADFGHIFPLTFFAVLVNADKQSFLLPPRRRGSKS